MIHGTTAIMIRVLMVILGWLVFRKCRLNRYNNMPQCPYIWTKVVKVLLLIISIVAVVVSLLIVVAGIAIFGTGIVELGNLSNGLAGLFAVFGGAVLIIAVIGIVLLDLFYIEFIYSLIVIIAAYSACNVDYTASPFLYRSLLAVNCINSFILVMYTFGIMAGI